MTTTAHLPYAFVAKLQAKDGSEMATFLTGALELAIAEIGTAVWFALRTDETTFWIVDAFADEAARTTHAEGEIVAALVAAADRLLAAPPEILPADVLAAKLP